jgi:hypothetical protein
MHNNIFAGTTTWNILQAPNPGAHTYSSNIVGGATTWNLNTMGNTGTVNISQNIGTAALSITSPSRSIAELSAGASGSNNLQIVNNQIYGTGIVYQGPVSGSLLNLNGNSILGTLTLNAQSASRGLTFTSNIINGTFTYNDNTVNAPSLGSITQVTNTNVNGTFILNSRASSSINMSNNNINTWTVSSDFDASSITSAGLRFLGIANNILFGGGNNNIYASGSMGAVASQRPFASNIFGGQNISASVVANDGNGGMVATIGVGHDLHIVGTARRDTSNTAGAGQTQGSAFFGRYNKLGQGFNTTGDVIFAVGTGTSGSAGITRKTGFLIDSGSNSYFEGTLNVSGSTTITGSLILSSSAAVELQVIGESQFTGSVGISNVLQLGQLNPLPAGADGQLAVSSSNLYFYSGSAWNKIAFG